MFHCFLGHPAPGVFEDQLEHAGVADTNARCGIGVGRGQASDREIFVYSDTPGVYRLAAEIRGQKEVARVLFNVNEISKSF
jgi:hypothetical protein